MNHYRTDDISFCSQHNCDRKKCYRHPDNRINKGLPYSVSNWEGTKLCAKVNLENETNEADIVFNKPIQPEERNKEIARLRENGLTYKTIAQKYNLSRQRIHQILNTK